MAVAACLLAAWLAGPAEANGPVAALSAPVAAVQQSAGQVATTVQSPAVRSSASPRAAARVHKARAAVAEPVVRSVAAVQPAAPVTSAATTVRTASTSARSAAEGAGNTARGAAKRSGARTRGAAGSVAKTARSAATKARAAAERTASKPAFMAARQRLAATAATTASYTASKLGAISLTAAPSGQRTEAATTEPAVTPLGAVAAALTFGRPAVAKHAGSPAAIAPIADGTARLEPVARAGRDHIALGAPASQPTGPASAGSASAGIATAALVGLFGFLIFASQRLGKLVRLRPEWAPMPPFLALPERPG